MTLSRIILPLLFAIFLISDLNAQTTDKKIIKDFFEIFREDPIKAFDHAFSTNQWMARNQDGIDNLKNQYANLIPLIGDYYGYELIVEKKYWRKLPAGQLYGKV